MLYEIRHRLTNEIIYSIEADSLAEAVERAVRENANLSWADLRGADLRGADLHRANLHRADLRVANLSWANLHRANLRGANLHRANLHRADLHRANLDFSCLPLWCGSFGMQVDSRFVRQLAAHLYRLKCDEPEGQAIQRLLRPARNAFCRDRSDVREVE